MEEYHRHYAVSEPKEDYEDRNRLYAMYVTREVCSLSWIAKR